MKMRHLAVTVIIAAAVAVPVTPAAAAPPGASPAATTDRPALPSTYVVSTDQGVLPEGIGIAPDGTMYVTGTGNGDVYRGHVTAASMRRFASGAVDGRGFAAGVHADARGRVFVAAKGTLDVYSATGRLIARRAASSGPVGDPFLNDLVITAEAVYVTDSTNAVVWRASLEDGRIGALERWLDVRPLVPGMPAQYWYLNGIDATPDGETLIVASQGLETLLRVDAATAQAEFVDLGDGVSFGPDGLVLRGSYVYGVENYAAPNGEQGVYVAQLDEAMTSGNMVAKVIDPSFDSPTTLALHDGRIYVVNSQFDHTPGTPPYTVSAVDDPLR